MNSSAGSAPLHPAAQSEIATDEPAVWPDERRQAFAALYRSHVGEIFGYCYRLLGNRSEAEDATSQVFTKALGAFGSVDHEAGSPRAWLFTIAHNVAVDVLRQRRTMPLPHEVARLPDRAPPLEEQAVVDDDLRSPNVSRPSIP